MGSAGDQDIFVFDFSTPGSASSSESIYGFETGLDQIAFVNTDATEAFPGDEALEGPHVDSSGDWSSVVSTNNDPGTTDPLVVLHGHYINEGEHQGGSTIAYVIDKVVAPNDVSVHADDPFLIA